MPSRDWIAWYRVVYPDDGIADPRPDLDAAFGDSLAWTQLLRYLWMQDGHDVDGLFGAFDGLRRLGACLVRRRVGAGLERGAIEAEEYAALRERYLVPRGGEVGKVLGRVAW